MWLVNQNLWIISHRKIKESIIESCIHFIDVCVYIYVHTYIDACAYIYIQMHTEGIHYPLG